MRRTAIAIVAIEPLGEESTYDVEMSADGPLNFLANGIVSHNSHAACYALIAYRTAWLKANYPAEYMAALIISSVMSTKDKVPFFATQAEQMGIEILPPDVNVSDHDFVVFEGNIRFGLDAVKGVGYAAVEAIKAAREEGGPFESLWDFCARVDARAVNKKAIEALIKCGAFGSTGATRKGMLMVLEQAQGAGQKAQQDLEIGQGSIFDSLDFGGDGANGNGAAAAFAAPAHPPIPSEEFEQPELLAIEKESIGLFISAHPLKQVREALREAVDCPLAELVERKDKDWVSAGGIITAAKKIRTRNGEHMMFATLDDLEGSRRDPRLRQGAGGVRGRARRRLGRARARPRRPQGRRQDVPRRAVGGAVRADARGGRAARGRRPRRAQVGPLPLHVRLDAATLPASVIDDLKHLLANFPGESEVVLEVRMSAGDPRTLRLGPSYKVAPTPTLRAELEHVLGPAALIAG